MNKSKFLTSCIITASLLGLCKVASANSISQIISQNSSSKTLNHKRVKVKSIPAFLMGQGIYNQTNNDRIGMPVAPTTCIDPKYFDVPKIENSTVSFDNTTAYDTMASRLGVNLDARFGWGRFSSDLSASYLKTVENTDYSMSANYANFLGGYQGLKQDGSVPYGKEILSSYGLKAYNDGQKPFLEACGDSVISQANYGAALIASLRVNLATRQEATEFKARVSLNCKLFNVTAAVVNAIKSGAYRGTISLSAYQAGGDPKRLVNIFGERNVVVGPDRSYAILACDASNIDACSAAVNNIIAYGKDDFIKQLEDGSKYVITGPRFINNWRTLGIRFDHPLDPRVLRAQMDITKWYDEDTKEYNFLKHYNAIMSPYMEPNSGKVLLGMVNKLHQRIIRYASNGALNCYGAYASSDCLGAWENVKTLRANYALTEGETEWLDWIKDHILVTFDGFYMMPKSTIIKHLAHKLVLVEKFDKHLRHQDLQTMATYIGYRNDVPKFTIISGGYLTRFDSDCPNPGKVCEFNVTGNGTNQGVRYYDGQVSFIKGWDMTVNPPRPIYYKEPQNRLHIFQLVPNPI